MPLLTRYKMVVVTKLLLSLVSVHCWQHQHVESSSVGNDWTREQQTLELRRAFFIFIFLVCSKGGRQSVAEGVTIQQVILLRLHPVCRTHPDTPAHCTPWPSTGGLTQAVCPWSTAASIHNIHYGEHYADSGLFTWCAAPFVVGCMSHRLLLFRWCEVYCWLLLCQWRVKYMFSHDVSVTRIVSIFYLRPERVERSRLQVNQLYIIYNFIQNG